MWTRTMIGALAALVLSGTVVAAEPYVGIGATRLSDLDSTGFRLHGGLRFDDDWSLEATVHRFNADGSPHGSHDLSTDVWSVGARYEFGDDALVPFAKIGVARMTTDGQSFGVPGNTRFSETDTGLMAEVGGRYAFNDQMSLRGGYEWFDAGEGDGGLNFALEFVF